MTSIELGARRMPILLPARMREDDEHTSRVEGSGESLLERFGPTAALGALTVVGGVRLLRANAHSKVLDVIDGVQLLSNPPTPGIFSKPRWGTPAVGSVFGPAPGARISIEHVDQGALGDCWNIAGMGGIAHRRPVVFEEMVREVGDHIEVALPGRTVRVTRELPLRDDGVPLYGGTDPRPSTDPDIPSLPTDPVLWSAYVEKAQAAVTKGGYRGLAGGFTKDSFRQLLGTNPVQVSSRGTVADDVIHHLRALTPVAISTPDTSRASRAVRRLMAELDIKHNHYYVPIEVNGDGPAATVKLFNPWGKAHPTRELSQAELRTIFEGLDTPDEFIRY